MEQVAIFIQKNTPFGGIIKFLKGDARHFQIIYLGLFLLYGIYALGWEADILKYAAVISGCLIVQAIGIQMTTKKWSSLKSGMITALGLCLLLKANSPWTMAFAGSIAIAGKYLIRIKGKHLFNPANFGIIAAVLLTGDAWVSPGQWGSSAIFVYFFGAAALIVLLKVGRIDTSIAFLATFMSLQFARTVLYQGWPMDHWLHQFSSGTILLFAFFMITDPMTIPNKSKGRIIWAILLAVLSFIATNWLYVHTAPIWILFFLAPVTVLLDKVYKGKKYQWKTQ